MADFTGGCCETFDMGDHGFQATTVNPGRVPPWVPLSVVVHWSPSVHWSGVDRWDQSDVVRGALTKTNFITT